MNWVEASKGKGIDFKNLYTTSSSNMIMGEPYEFLQDFTWQNSKQTFSANKDIGFVQTYKKGQIVYPYAYYMNEKRQVSPAFLDAISKGVLVKKKDFTEPIRISNEEVSYNESLTDKIFGKQGMFGRPRTLTLMIIGAIAGGYYSKTKNYNILLGVIVGGAIPLVAQQLLEKSVKSKVPVMTTTQMTNQSKT